MKSANIRAARRKDDQDDPFTIGLRHIRRGEEIGENDKCLHLPTISFWRKVQGRLGCLLSGCFVLFTSFADFNIDEAGLLEP